MESFPAQERIAFVDVDARTDLPTSRPGRVFEAFPEGTAGEERAVRPGDERECLFL